MKLWKVTASHPLSVDTQFFNDPVSTEVEAKDAVEAERKGVALLRKQHGDEMLATESVKMI